MYEGKNQIGGGWVELTEVDPPYRYRKAVHNSGDAIWLSVDVAARLHRAGGVVILNKQGTVVSAIVGRPLTRRERLGYLLRVLTRRVRWIAFPVGLAVDDGASVKLLD